MQTVVALLVWTEFAFSQSVFRCFREKTLNKHCHCHLHRHRMRMKLIFDAKPCCGTDRTKFRFIRFRKMWLEWSPYPCLFTFEHTRNSKLMSIRNKHHSPGWGGARLEACCVAGIVVIVNLQMNFMYIYTGKWHTRYRLTDNNFISMRTTIRRSTVTSAVSISPCPFLPPSPRLSLSLSL